MIKRIAIAALMTAAVSALPSHAWAQVLADSGFRPKPNGFSFENWGGKTYPDSRLTPDDVRFLFGDQACARIKSNLCVPTPGATLWIDQMNKTTEGGHCEGMAVLSASFFADLDSVDEFGARQTYELKPDNDLLMRTISTYFTTQSLEPVQSATSATQAWPLQKIVDSLVATINAGDDYPTLGIYFQDGGHAVTPYAVEARGEGQYRILIYDNNYPGAEKYIDVDIPRDRWIYAGGALNPGENASSWQGSSGSMDITLLSVRNEPLKCPFCATTSKPKPRAPGSANPKPGSSPAAKPKPKTPARKPVSVPSKPGPQRKPEAQRKPGGAAQSYSVVTPNRCSQLQATGKKNKKQIRMSASGIDNQISGASMRPMRGSRGCMISLPPGEEYDVRLIDDGRASGQASTSLSIFGAGKAWTVDNVSIRSGATETFSVSEERFTYTAGSKQRPTLRVADGNNASNDYYEVSGFDLNEGFEFSAQDDEFGRMAFSDNDPDIDAFDVYAEIVGEEDTLAYEFDDISTGDDGQAMFDFDEDGGLELELDSDSDGIIDDFDEDFDSDEANTDDEGDEAGAVEDSDNGSGMDEGTEDDDDVGDEAVDEDVMPDPSDASGNNEGDDSPPEADEQVDEDDDYTDTPESGSDEDSPDSPEDMDEDAGEENHEESDDVLDSDDGGEAYDDSADQDEEDAAHEDDSGDEAAYEDDGGEEDAYEDDGGDGASNDDDSDEF